MAELTEEKILRVKSDSNVQALAQAIAHALYDDHHVVVRAIGAGAVGQAVKAIAVARGYVAPRGYDLVDRPGFADVVGKEGTITAIIFNVSI